MGLGRGPGRFLLGGEVLLEQLGADPEAGGTWNGAADWRLLWPLRVVLWTALLVIAFCGITAIVFNTSAPACGARHPRAPKAAHRRVISGRGEPGAAR
jgi:hypothetical protein